MNYRHFIITVLIGLGLLGAFSDTIFAAYTWTAIGSDGTPDDANREYVQYTGTTVELKPSFLGTVIMRYNVDEADLHDDRVLVEFRYRDNGPGARVVVTLKEHNFETGAVTDVESYDSNDHSQSSGFQEGSFITDVTYTCNFYNNAYYVEVKLQRTASDGRPGLSQIRMSWIIC